jgi:hypothetical protein
MKTILAAMILGLSLGVLAGQSSTESGRSLASAEASHGTFEDLPCPTEAEFLELAKRTRLQIPEGAYACDSSPKSKLARVLFFMDRLEVELPESWGGAARETLVDPLEYVIKMANSLVVDFTQTDSIAQNFRITGDVFLGGYFFQIEPLFAVAVLIHEARHSEDTSPGHDRCRGGDIPKSEGGCDAKFSLGPDAGAYSYGAIFEIGLAEFAKNLSVADREYLRSLALVHMVSRFNEVHPEFGAPVDILLVLDEDGDAFFVDPYSLKLSPIESNEKFRKVEFSPRGAGAFLYTKNDQVYVWSPAKGLAKAYSDILPTIPGAIDIDKIITGVSRVSKTFVVGSENQFYFVDSERSKGKDILTKYREPPEEKVKKITIANGWSSFFLTEDGDIMSILSSPRGGQSPNFYSPYKIFSERKWTQIHGGITYDQLFGVDREGNLYFEGPAPDQSGLGAVPSDWKVPQIAKYLEGTNFRVFLDRAGKVFAARYLDQQEGRVEELAIEHDKKIIDFALPRSYLPTERLLSLKPAPEYAQKCKLNVSFVDPVMQRPMGVNGGGQLIAGSECLPLGYVGAGKAEFVGEELSQKTKGFAPAALKIGNSKVVPYFPRFQK